MVYIGLIVLSLAVISASMIIGSAIEKNIVHIGLVRVKIFNQDGKELVDITFNKVMCHPGGKSFTGRKLDGTEISYLTSENLVTIESK